MKDHVIGVDIGTTGTKTGIYDTDGRLVADAFEESILHYPAPGHVEQDPDTIHASVRRTLRAAMARSGLSPDRIACIALDGQMAGLLAIDRDWQPVTYYDSWLDTRCAPYLKQLRPHETDIIRSCGMALAFNHAPKILYWRDRPEIWRRIHAFIQPAAYSAGKLAGLSGKDAFIDYTYMAFTGFGSGESFMWNKELLARFDLTDEKLPRIVKPWEIIGHVTGDEALKCGLHAGTPIAAGCGDQAANVLGAGLVEPGMIFDTSGTASVFATVIDNFGTDTAYRCLITCPHVIPGLYTPMAYVAGGGLNLRWFRDEVSPMEKAGWEAEGINPYDALISEAAKMPPGAEKLLFIPHLSGRNTPNDPTMRGAFLGLNWRHGKAHMVRAMMESVAYEYGIYLQAVRKLASDYHPRMALNIGGGARSAVFRQIKADVLGIDYCSLARDEFGTLGSAIVAGHAAGLFPNIAATARQFAEEPADTIISNADVTKHYAPYLKLYAETLEQLSGLFARMDRELD